MSNLPLTTDSSEKVLAAEALDATDILIVGAGPAGATTSLFLSQAKIPHTIIDSATFPRDKADGNVYGTKVIEVLDALSLDYFPELVSQADQFLGCDTAQIFTPNGNRFNLRFPHSSVDSSANTEHSAETDSQADDSEQDNRDIPCFTMNRRDFDHFLVKKLDSNYAHQRFGTSLKAVEEKADSQSRWQVSLKQSSSEQASSEQASSEQASSEQASSEQASSEQASSEQSSTGTHEETIELSPKLIVAADGVNSTFLKEINFQLPTERYYDTVQGYFRGVIGFEEDTAQSLDSKQTGHYFHFEGHFLPESTPGFFFVVPLANNIFNVGVGKPRRDVEQQNVDLSQLLQDIIHNHPQFYKRFAKAEPISELRRWPLAAGATNRSAISGDGYLVVGDAAGLCTPLTYFGTGNAMLSGMIAAQQIQRSVSQQSFEARSLIAYDRAVYSKLQKEFQAANITRAFIKRNWLFDLVSSSAPVKSVLRRSLKHTSTMLKKL